MKVRWLGAARAEAEAAAVFYNEKQPNLAQRFLDELEETLTAYNAILGPIDRWKAKYASVVWRISPMA